MRRRVALLLAGWIFVMNAHFIVGVKAAGTGFKDVKPDHWAGKAIEAAVGKGYFKGYADGTFQPNTTVTRAEFAALLARVAEGEADVNPAASFADLAGHWSEAE